MLLNTYNAQNNFSQQRIIQCQRNPNLQKGNKLETLEQVKGQLTSDIILLVEAI